MKKVAIIIKHQFRDYDYRVDIVEVPEESYPSEVASKYYEKLLGPFEIVAATDKVDMEAKLKVDDVQ